MKVQWDWLCLAIIVASMASCTAISDYAHARYGYGNCQKVEASK